MRTTSILVDVRVVVPIGRSISSSTGSSSQTSVCFHLPKSREKNPGDSVISNSSMSSSNLSICALAENARTNPYVSGSFLDCHFEVCRHPHAQLVHPRHCQALQ